MHIAHFEVFPEVHPEHILLFGKIVLPHSIGVYVVCIHLQITLTVQCHRHRQTQLSASDDSYLHLFSFHNPTLA